MLYLPDKGADDAVAIFAGHFHEDDKPGVPLDQGRDVAILSSSKKVAFPMPRDRPVLYLGRPLSDGYRVNDLSTRLSPCGGVFASAHQSSGPQTRDQLFPQDAASLNEQTFVDRLVRYPHWWIISVFDLQPAGDLLRRPIFAQFPRHDHL
jgi:hypothetical protein